MVTMIMVEHVGREKIGSLQVLVAMIDDARPRRCRCRRDMAMVLAILHVLANTQQPVTIKHLSMLANTSPTAVYRIVKDLNQIGITKDVGNTVMRVSIKDEYRHVPDDDLVKIILVT